MTPYLSPVPPAPVPPAPVPARRRGRRGILLGAVLALVLVVAPGLPTGLQPDSAHAASYANPATVTGNITVHDPSMVRRPDGTYLLASTAPGIALRTSTDRKKYSYAGVAFPHGASWTDRYTKTSNGNLWAPDLSYRNGTYLMYYAASSFGSNTSAIFLATSSTGLPGSWTHRGLVYSTTASSNHNAIDPNLVVDSSGKWWLTLGSFWTGIKMIRLDPRTGLRLSGDSTVRSIARRSGGSTAIEAPSLLFHSGYYYLFTSWDLCCKGTRSTYRIMVARSTSVTGPYTDRSGTAAVNGGGTEVLASHAVVIGPGGQSTLTVSSGDLLVYHYYDANSGGTATLGVNSLGWDAAGWPYVR
jgi:arabinan endo-1,5-alpha-L-arabinosidase